MPKITFLPHREILPNGITITAKTGDTILEAALKNNIQIEHTCEKSCVCTTCHCIIKKGFNSLSKIQEDEDDILGQAAGLEEHSRLSCQAKIGNKNIEIEIPYNTLRIK
ncbi:2Fe-2S ferredoxin [Buchnera aphidicola (Anoecia corni)]|uniref:2Fe-2S ferredoxin n=1 Tax=Buchnera aphidicola (Anoecia corni) TaxID=2994477 RepID=A0AAT9IIU2_9GAMM